MLCSLRRFTRSNLFKTFRSVSTIQRSALSYIFQGSIQIECSTSSTIARLLGSSSTVMATATGNGAKCNRLAQEKSPYLQQHATNPVDWYPWGEAAFQKARQENKPIFLSVGYSTCHWCHVMERESFCDSDIGNILNHNFVSIKVDREERPDVDKMYMTFVQATSGQGGWPMSVWLTPDLKPIVGGTYFPPDDRFGRPGFRTILLNLARKWREDRDQLAQQSSRVMDALNRAMIISPPDGTSDIPNKEDILSKCHQSFVDSYDAQRGGFGNAPKFPQPVKLNLLFSSTYWFDAANQEKSDQAKCIALHTLEKMADGGIHDHVSKGFHRYSVDGEWHLPHFEKMLYDQAQLVTAYLDGYVISKEQKYADVAQDILEYVSRDLSDKCGGFYSAEDADSLPCDAVEGASAVKREGAFCVWTDDEIRRLLSEQVEGRSDVTWADVFAKHYGVKKEGNVNLALDHHNELKNKNVLKVSCTLEATAQCFNLSVDTTQEILDKCKQILYEARLKRPRPHLDDKMLTSWNGLMLSAFARGGQVLQGATFTKRAIDAAKFLHEYMYNNATQTLLRSCYVHEGKPAQLDTAIDGFADDYAFLIRGLLDLYDTCFDERWIEWAQQLQATQDQLFWDDETGGYYNTSSKDPSILLRLKEDQDGAEPSANSISTCNLVRLATLLDCAQHRERARKLVTTFTKHLTEAPHILPQMVCGLMCLHTPPQEIVLLGKESDPEIQRMLQCVRSEYLPNKVVILLGGAAGGEGDDDESFLTRSNHFLRGLAEQATASTTSNGTPSATAYVCQNYTCSLPVHDAEDLKQLLLRRPAASSEAAPSASDNNPSQPSGKL